MTNPTSNYNFQMPTATDLVTDLPADFEVFGQAVDTRLKALQPGTTLGDFAYSSATANTNTRLPIGTSGQVLAVSGGGVPAWTTPAGATLSLSLVASGTLSGASLTLSSLSTYDTLVLMISNLNQSTGAQLRLRVNNNSTSNYWAIGFAQNASNTNRLIMAGDTSWTSSNNVDSGANGNEFVYQLQSCKAAGFTSFGYSGSYNSFRTGEVAVSGMYAVAEAVSSLVLSPTGGTFSGGNYRIYGG